MRAIGRGVRNKKRRSQQRPLDPQRRKRKSNTIAMIAAFAIPEANILTKAGRNFRPGVRRGRKS